MLGKLVSFLRFRSSSLYGCSWLMTFAAWLSRSGRWYVSNSVCHEIPWVSLAVLVHHEDIRTVGVALDWVVHSYSIRLHGWVSQRSCWSHNDGITDKNFCEEELKVSVGTGKSVVMTVSCILRKVISDTPHAARRKIKVKTSFTRVDQLGICGSRSMPQKFVMRLLF